MELERPVTRWRRENRPLSRAGEDDRPLSRRGNISTPSIAGDRPRVVVRPPTGSVYQAPGSARIPSAAMQADRGVMSIHSRRERLISQQGLSGLRTGTSRERIDRQVQDNRYFQSVLQVKMGQLAQEMGNLRKQMDKDSREHAAYLIYDRRVKEIAMELTEAQRKLADYNLAMDKLNTGGDIPKLLQEAKELANNNDLEANAIEVLFSDRIRRQEAVAKLEAQVKMEKNKALEVIADMSPQMKEQYNEMKRRNEEASKKLDQIKRQLDSINKSKTSLTDQIFLSPAKSEVVRLELKLWELESKEENLRKEQHLVTSPTSERDSLLAKVKEDNAHMISMERAIIDTRERIKQVQESLSQKTQAKGSTGRFSKFNELKKREQSIEEFLLTVEDLKSEELTKLKSLENEVAALLQNLANEIATLPTAADYRSIEQTDTDTKADILNTTTSLSAEHKNLSQYLNKVGIMEKRVKTEIANLKSKLVKMSEEIIKFSDLESLESSVEEKGVKLRTQRDELEADRPTLLSNLKDANDNYNHLQQRLIENETNAQLVYLERKLATIGQSNFSIAEYIKGSIHDEDVETYRSNALQLMVKLNENLQNITQ